jgi:hypothetical protein
MDIQMLTIFFMWCTLLNVGLLIVSFIMLFFAGDFVYKMQSKYFAMTRESFNASLYLIIGLYKIAVFVFNLIPWIALLIISR